jgi:hypothetical protein
MNVWCIYIYINLNIFIYVSHRILVGVVHILNLYYCPNYISVPCFEFCLCVYVVLFFACVYFIICLWAAELASK